MKTQIQQYDLLWIQAIPSIANIYYHKYLKETHVIHCPDKDLPIRAVARSIMSTLRTNGTKKMALYFEQPCSDTKRRSIFEFILKHQPDLTCFCLSVPCAPLQPSLLLGWAAGLTNSHWKELCSNAYDPEACVPFQPPTTKSGQSACKDFETMFAMSASIFNKEALFVHFTHHLLSFDAEQGLILAENAENAIQGWIEAFQGQLKTLIWIIDEKKLYGDAIYNVNQEGRDTLLQKYRQMVSDRIQSFNATIPVYGYILDYFHITSFSLLQALAQLQHRHNINIAGSTLLTWSNEETASLNQYSFYNLNCIYLQQKPIFNISKWKYLHQSSETPSSKDKLKYVSPDILQLEDDLTTVYRVPLLKSTGNSLPLTKSEEIAPDIRHTVSAKTVEVFDSWAEFGLKQDLELISEQDISAAASNDAGVQPFEAKERLDEDAVQKQLLQDISSSLTIQNISAFIGNEAYIKRGLELKHQVNQLSINTNDGNDQIQMTGNIPIESSSGYIKSTVCFSKQEGKYIVVKAKCTCPIGNWGNYTPSQQQPSEEAGPFLPSSSPLLTKRSYDASEEDNDSSSNESRKRANASVESSWESTSTVAYDPSAPPSAPTSHSTDEEGTVPPTFAPNISPLSNPSLQSVSVYHSSSNEKSSYSGNSLSSSSKEVISISSSNSLSDNQQLRESLEQIQESHHEEDEEAAEQQESVEIIEQIRLDFQAPPTDASSTNQEAYMLPSKEHRKQQDADSLINVESQEEARHDDDDGDDEDEDDDDDLPETQPCF